MASTVSAWTTRISRVLAAPRIRLCLAFGFHFALWLWLIDLIRVAKQGLSPVPAIALGLGAALFRAFACTLAPTFALGCVAALYELHARAWERPPLLARVAAYLQDGAGAAAEHSRKSGALLAFALLGLGFCWAAARSCEVWIVGMARPQYAALACMASCVVLLLMAAAAFPALAVVAGWLCSGLARIPVLGPRCFARTAQYAAWLAAAACAVVGVFVFRFREPLGFLPWASIAQVLGGAAAAGCSLVSCARLPVRTRRLRTRAAGAVVVLSLAIAALQSPLAVRARQISERETLTGRLGQAALLWAWDRDRDGYLPAFGGGDCAPRNASRNPGATDIPGNGIDEDCDGGDLTLHATAARGKYDYPVPANFPQRPPIVLITVDAFAASHMHALGYTRALTPHIDAFAARSVFFRQAYAQGPSTRLSFPSLFASRWDTQIVQELVGHHPFPIAPSELLLAEVLQRAGYETTAILSDGYFSPRFWRGITRGFEHIVESPFTTAPRVPHGGPRVTDAAIEELKRPGDKPRFLWVHYYDAHSPHVQPADVPALGKTRKDIYDAELNLVDREVGRLLDAVEAQWSGKALVVLTADHGIAFDEPRHATFNYGYDLYTSVLHVPLIVHAPLLTPRALDNVVSTMDIAPTLANLLRLRERLPYEGMSLVPELFTGRGSRPPELMHQMFIEERKWKHEEPLERVALRTDRFNLLLDRKTGLYELYDYRNDPLETEDLALDPLYGATLASLRRQLTSLLYSAEPKPQLSGAELGPKGAP